MDGRLRATFGAVLTVATALSLLWSAALIYTLFAGATGLMAGPTSPLGADFINLWTAGLMTLAHRSGEIYAWQAFSAYQQDFLGVYIGHRLWAYPPHSLLFVWPFGLAGYKAALVAWSLLGLAVMAAGALKFGLSRRDAVILVCSPGALECLVNGQSGNLACGLLLAGLAFGRTGQGASALSAAILTVKPQLGILLPLVWIRNRQWRLILWTIVLTVSLAALSAAVFGLDVWRLYLGSTLPELSNLERNGDGDFMQMIPSVFMSGRLLGLDGNTAFAVHLAFAVIILAFAAWRIFAETDPWRQAPIMLVATCLISPYMHSYDLTLLLGAALIMLRANKWGILAVLIAWPLPALMIPFAEAGAPIAPLLILTMFVIACWPVRRTETAAAAPAAA